MISDNEDKRLADILRVSKAEGMQDFNQSLHDLVKRGYVSEEAAMESSPNPEQLSMLLKGIRLGSDGGTLTGS